MQLLTTVILSSCRYEGLDKFIKMRLLLRPKSARFVAAKVAMDGLIFGPFDLFVFFTYMGFSAGKSTAQVKEDVKRDFLPALILEGGVWPIVQVANFRYVPVRYQLLYVNIFCLLDSAFLSWIEQQKDAPWKRRFTSFISMREKGGQGRLWYFCPHFCVSINFLFTQSYILSSVQLNEYSCTFERIKWNNPKMPTGVLDVKNFLQSKLNDANLKHNRMYV